MIKKIFSVLCLILLSVHQTQATNFTVTTTAGDTTAGSFGDALTDTNDDDSRNDTVDFASPLFDTPQTITLTTSMPALVKNSGVTVGIAAQSATTIEGGAFGVLQISGGGTFSLTNIIINGSSASGIDVSDSSTLNTANAINTGITLDGGTIGNTAGTTSSGNIAIANDGGTISIGNGFTSTFSGQITGLGGLIKQGAGTLVLTNTANSQAGATDIEAGILSIAGDGALGGPGTITIDGGGTLRTTASFTSGRNITLDSGGGVLDVATGITTTLTGSVDGAGSLTKSSAGTLILGTDGSYAGATLVTGGVLAIVDGTSLGNTTGVTLAGGTLRADGAVTSAHSFATGAGGGTINTNGFDVSISGGFSGSTGLTKTGLGILTLSGAGTNTGSTAISAGTLRLGANNAAGSGVLSTAAGAIFNMNGFNQTAGAATNAGQITTGQGTLTVPSYSGAGTLSVEAKATPNMNVSGTANVTGGTLALATRPLSGSYTIINAGTLTGTFSTISLPTRVIATPVYSGTTVVLNVTTLLDFAPAGSKPNNAAVGRALNELSTAPMGDLATVMTVLNNLEGAELSAALDEISPVALAALGGMSLAGAGMQSAAVGQRLNGLRAANSNGSRLSFFSSNEKSRFPGTLVADPIGDVSSVSGAPESVESPWGVFASAIGADGKLDAVSGKKGSQPGYTYRAGGAVLGVDYRFSDNFTGGLSGGYVTGTSEIDANGGSIKSESMRAGLYGTAHGNNIWVNLYAGGAYNLYETNRNLTFGTISRTAKGTPRASEFNFSFLGGYDYETAHAVLTPFFGFTADNLQVGAYSESGAGTMDLAVSNNFADSVRSAVGAKVGRMFHLGAVKVSPYLSAAWLHEYADQSRAISARFSSGSTFTIDTPDLDRDTGAAGAGLNMDWTDSFSTRLAYTGEMRDEFTGQSANATLRLKF